VDGKILYSNSTHLKANTNNRKLVEKESTTTPESGYMVRAGRPEGFLYLDYRTVDRKNNIITDVHVTPGNVND
jgi:hypothetical protein